MADPKIHQLATSQAQLTQIMSGSGGGNDGYDARLARIEARLEGMERRLDDVKTDIARVESKLINKWDIAQVVFFVVGALMAAAALGPRIASLIAV